MTDLLALSNLRTQFRTERGAVKAVDGIDLDIEPGETVGLVGESGSGKSVTALSAMDLIDDPGEIVDGRVTFRSAGLAGRLLNEFNRALVAYPFELIDAVYAVADDLRAREGVRDAPRELRGIAADLDGRADPAGLAAALRSSADDLDDRTDPEAVGASLASAVDDATDGFVYVDDDTRARLDDGADPGTVAIDEGVIDDLRIE